MANTSCDDNFIPDPKSLPIPQDINVMIAPGSNTSLTPMVTCCQPNPVQVVDSCTLWCELPKSYFDRGASHQDVEDAASNCLRVNRGNSTWPKSHGFQMNVGARTGSWTVKKSGILVLALAGLVHLM
ncbi:hypothetical protein CONLIGDRAFT_697571 [Coniochaeta ligniaria NRRL 30616]|uniref:Uncharacterized protein n=1 Tax=Coniochaeta ligniaria NRRL 30616 TaxID=1408157 RepID=A0A1J7I445_9PEZI|nr:hypothetical protein CONLIGDRAFT_697571 [Coniochaeta ligniaria NRRL 30616]